MTGKEDRWVWYRIAGKILLILLMLVVMGRNVITAPATFQVLFLLWIIAVVCGAFLWLRYGSEKVE